MPLEMRHCLAVLYSALELEPASEMQAVSPALPFRVQVSAKLQPESAQHALRLVEHEAMPAV